MKNSHRLLATSAVALVFLSAATGCNSKKTQALPADPKTALVASVTNLGGESSASVSMSFKDPQGSLLKAMTKNSSASDTKLAKRVLAGTLRFTVAGAGGSKLNDPKAKHDGAMELIEGQTTDVAVSFISGDLYVHIDKAFLAQVGGAQAVSTLSGFSPALANGGTVKVPGIVKTASDFASGLGASASMRPTPSFDPQAVFAQMKTAFMSAATVTKSSSDTYNVSVAVKPLASAFVTLFTHYAQGLGGTAAQTGLSGVQSAVAKLPDGSISGTVTVNGSKISQIAVDLQSVGDLAKKASPNTDVPDLSGAQLLIAFGSSTSGLTAPSGAIELNVASLLGKFLSGFGALGGSSSSSSTAQLLPPCSALPPNVKIACAK